MGLQGVPAVLPSAAREFHSEPLAGEAAGLRMVWSGFDVAPTPDLRVTVDVTLDTVSPTSLWSIAIDGLAQVTPLEVHFPCIGSLAARDHESLAAPQWLGELTDKPRELLNAGGQTRRLEWSYPGIMSLQCIAFYSANAPGLYAACDDTAAYGKRFAFFGDGKQGASFEVVQLPERSAESNGTYRSPYRVALGLLNGDWFTAAERYRAWSLQQAWARDSRLKKDETAKWAVDTGLWVWNRGRSENVLQPAAELQAASGVPVSVFWHWWHGCAYDVGFPEYLPPREGAENFKSAINTAHNNNLHAIVYMNQRLWGMTTESWRTRDAARFAVKGPDGTIRPEVYNTFSKAPCASMCMGTSFWRDTYAGLAAEAVNDLGVDGIYMDQACSSLSCYDARHGHPIGGGTYWIKGFQSLQADIRNRCNHDARTVTLAGEGCGEAWLPYLDLMLSLQVSMERYAAPKDWRPIPFFHAVYHGYCIPYGNYSSLTMPPYDELWPKESAPAEPLKLLDRKFAQQFRLEQARAFAWGQVPTIANFRPGHLVSRAEEMNFVIQLAKLRLRALDFLLHGTMLRAPEMEIPESEIPISRLSIYAGQQDALKEYTARHPQMLLSAWRNDQGSAAIVVVNIADTPQRIAFNLSKREWNISGTAIRVLEGDGAERSMSCNDSVVVVDEPIPATSGRIYLLSQ